MTRACRWCEGPIPSPNPRAEFCKKRCRQAAFRLRQRSDPASAFGAPAGARFAYADPPYPGFARKLYGHPETDHAALIARLEADGYLGWALSTSMQALRDLLPLCPPRKTRVCAWVKPIGASGLTRGLHNCWEPLIVVGGRRKQPGVRDWLRAMPARGGGDLVGRKPLAFCAWLFDCLGMVPGDELVDLFPGTGVVGRSWRELGGTVAEDHRDIPTVAESSSDGSRR